MKHKILFLFAAMCCLQMQATQLVIQRSDHTKAIQDIAAIGKWMYSGDYLQLVAHDGTLLAEEHVANIRKIIFADDSEETAIGQTVQDNVIRVYPNPTHDRLMVEGAEVGTMRIYDLQGRLLKTETGTGIDVYDLPDGLYLLQIGTQVIRFTKQ